jgi:Fe-Mn family superoxide dismutase
VWLAYDHDWNTLTTVIGDAQNTFPLWNATPVLALDVYEHAYWLDYGRLRAKYIEAFFNNLDWAAVNANLEKALAMQAVTK